MRLFIDDTDITEGIDSNIWRAIEKSIENNSIETFRVLKFFVRKVLQEAIKQKSLKHFQQYIFFPSYYYSVSYEKLKHNSALTELHSICGKAAAMHLKEILWLDIDISGRKLSSIEQKKTFNQLSYWAFNGFSRLFYFIVKNGDLKHFKISLDEYKQLSRGNYSTSYDLKFKIKEIKRKKSAEPESEELRKLIETFKLDNEFSTYQRHVLVGVKYWIFFLYNTKNFSETTTLSFIEKLNIPYHDSEDVIKDIFFFRTTNIDNYLDWSSWDFMERPNGETYTPPSPYDWLTFGFMVDQIRENRLFINLNEYDEKEINLVNFLFQSLKDYADFFQNNFSEWKKILKVKTKKELKAKCDSILLTFSEIKRKVYAGTEQEIVRTPISEEKIEEFKNLIGNAWRSQTRISTLFKRHNSAQLITDQETMLKIIGQKTFIEKGKMMFIDGKHHQKIYGMDKLGGEVGRWEDDEFFRSIRNDEFNKIAGKDLEISLDMAIGNLKDKGFVADVILLSSDLIYKSNFYFECKKFISSNHDAKTEELPFFLLGKFDGISVYTSFSRFLENNFVIADFTKAFRMRYKASSHWFDEELNIQVHEVTQEQAEGKLRENTAKWTNTTEGNILREEDALELIKTSVIIDIWTTKDFIILNKEAYTVGYLEIREENQ